MGSYTPSPSASVTAHVAESDPHTQYQQESEKGQASGYAGLDGSSQVPAAQAPAKAVYATGGGQALTPSDIGAQSSDADLDAVAGLATTGLVARTGAGTAATRSVAVGSASLTIADGDGVAGDPTLDTAQDIQTSASPSFAGLTLTGTPLAVTGGGTGATTASGARTNLGVPSTGAVPVALFSSSWVEGADQANSTVTERRRVTADMTVTEIAARVGTINTQGTHTISVTGASNALLSTDPDDLTALVAGTWTALTLTGTTANLDLSSGDELVIAVASNNASFDGADITFQVTGVLR